MKLNKTCKEIALIAISLVTASQGYAGSMGPVMLDTAGKTYISAFGGGGTSNHLSIKQFGTAFFFDAEGGALAVNGFGSSNSGSAGLVGGNVGYQWAPNSLSLFNSLSALTPAVELEGYYLGKSTFTGHDINNETTRLTEHDFLVTYPMNSGVFLINAIANFDLANQPRLHPYAGVGLGAAVLSISNADATQVSPAEVGVNHYNSNTNSTDTVFAGQVKAGLNVALNKNISLFGEYRWLYLSGSNYTFGSTVYPELGHVATSSWLVSLGSQSYNLGVAGIRYTM